jgi:hypothetical protein
MAGFATTQMGGMRVGGAAAGSVPLWNAISAPPGEDVRPSASSSRSVLEPILEQRNPVAVVEPERGELVLDRFLGDVPGARAEDRPPAGQHVERRPGLRELQGPALRGDEACRPELPRVVRCDRAASTASGS